MSTDSAPARPPLAAVLRWGLTLRVVLAVTAPPLLEAVLTGA